MSTVELHLWRHPRLRGSEGLCVGALDWPIDRRRARRLARRIARYARQHDLPRAIASSPLARCAAVARHLRALGWRVRIDPRLRELDFGGWQGRPWADIPRSEIAAWEADFLHYRAGAGESLAALRARLAAYVAEVARGLAPALAITHAGCIAALATLDCNSPSAAAWSACAAAGSLTRLRVGGAAVRAAVP